MTFYISCNLLHWIVDNVYFNCSLYYFSGYAVAQLFETLCYKVAGSIPDGVIGMFHNPSGRTIALGLTQPLTEMSTRNISSGVKAAGV